MEEDSSGYIYILQNESLAEDRLKIGRTFHDPNSRAEDISRSTGVPTPFEVIWYAFSQNCVEAERLVHHTLSEYRTNPRREFFDVDLDLAIDAAEEAVATTGGYVDWWDRATAGRRTFGAFLFHSIARPIARLPVVVILFFFWTAWLLVKWTALLAFSVLSSCLFLLKRLVGIR